MQRYRDLIAASRSLVEEIFPWELMELRQASDTPLVLDVRDRQEFAALHIAGSVNVPRGVLESACEYGYEETVTELVEARERPLVTVCRSGSHALLAARTLQILGFREVYSLKTGLRGWSEYSQPLVDEGGRRLPDEEMDRLLGPRMRPVATRRTSPRRGARVFPARGLALAGGRDRLADVL